MGSPTADPPEGNEGQVEPARVFERQEHSACAEDVHWTAAESPIKEVDEQETLSSPGTDSPEGMLAEAHVSQAFEEQEEGDARVLGHEIGQWAGHEGRFTEGAGEETTERVGPNDGPEGVGHEKSSLEGVRQDEGGLQEVGHDEGQMGGAVNEEEACGVGQEGGRATGVDKQEGKASEEYGAATIQRGEMWESVAPIQLSQDAAMSSSYLRSSERGEDVGTAEFRKIAGDSEN